MDPNANLAEQRELFEKCRGVFNHKDRCRLFELRNALNKWLNNGGFEPDWSKAGDAIYYWRNKNYGKA